MVSISRPKCFYLSPSAVQVLEWFAIDRGCTVTRNGRTLPNLSAAVELLAEEIRSDFEPHYAEVLEPELMPWEIAHDQWSDFMEGKRDDNMVAAVQSVGWACEMRDQYFGE